MGLSSLESFKFLGEKTYFLGDDITYADLAFAWSLSFLDSTLRSFEIENPLEKVENLVELAKRVLALPGIAEFEASEKKKSIPLLLHGQFLWLKENSL